MCRAKAAPMAPSPITPVRRTGSIASSMLAASGQICSFSSHARAPRPRFILVDPPRSFGSRHDDTVFALRRLHGHGAVAYIGKHALGLAHERIAVAAAAGSVEAKSVVRAQGIIGIARRQTFLFGAAGIDADIAGASVVTAGAPLGRHH